MHILYFRGFYLCANKQAQDFVQKQLDIAFIESYVGPGEYNREPIVTHAFRQDFPGYLDRGSPLIIDEGGRQTVIGLFKEQENAHRDRPNLFLKIHTDAFNWIVKNTDETHDSNCESFTSCSCGIPGKPKPQSTPRR